MVHEQALRCAAQYAHWKLLDTTPRAVSASRYRVGVRNVNLFRRGTGAWWLSEVGVRAGMRVGGYLGRKVED